MSLEANQTYILYANDGTRRVDVARPGDYVKIKRQSFPVNDLIGHEYGTVFEAKGKHLYPTDEPLDVVDEAEIENEDDTHDNRDLIDTNTSQALRENEIKELKAKGLEGDELIQAIAQSSTTFETKTEYSQKKYLRKKAQKHIIRCLLVETNAHTILEQQYLKNPSKLNFMRFDCLASILSQSQIMAGKSVAVFDECMGIVAGAIAERMAGHGHLYRIYDQFYPSDDCVNRFNFPPHIKYWINPIAYTDFIHIQKQDYTKPLVDYYTESNTNGNNSEEEGDASQKDNKTAEGEEFKKEFTEKEKEIILRKRQIREYKRLYREPLYVRNNIISKGVDCLVLACNEPLNYIAQLLPYLSPSGILCVYTPYQQIGTEIYAGLKKGCQFINLQLSENWMRKYQVLPQRTHPHMNMFNTSGFIVTGIRVLTEDNEKQERVYKKGNMATVKVNKKKLRLF